MLSFMRMPMFNMLVLPVLFHMPFTIGGLLCQKPTGVSLLSQVAGRSPDLEAEWSQLPLPQARNGTWDGKRLDDEFHAMDSTDSENAIAAGKAPLQLPAEPGCYVWARSGCPRHPSASVVRKWVRDAVGEAQFAAAENRTSCEKLRGRQWRGWCAAEDVEVRLVAEPPPLPEEPGCYVWAPSGCARHPRFQAWNWTHDTFGEAMMLAAENRSTCEEWRQQQYLLYCGVSDLRVRFVQAEEGQEEEGRLPVRKMTPTAPKEPGCYVWTPEGCPRKPRFGMKSNFAWQRDVPGEIHFNASTNKDACELLRGKAYSGWCGGVDVHMSFIPQVVTRAPATISPEPEEVSAAFASTSTGLPPSGDVLPPLPTSKPGCYVLAPAGCPRQPTARVGREWIRDAVGEAKFGAATDRTTCEQTRRRSWQEWCGIEDVELRMVAAQPPLPDEAA